MTAQYPDLINYQGEKYPLFSNPLESYFNENHPRPNFKGESTAIWRGYTAEWKIENEVLYLVNLNGWVWVDDDQVTDTVDARELSFEDIFSFLSSPVKATWFSGKLRIPQGELLEYVHMGYESVYDQDILLTIEKGCLVKTKVKTNRPLPRFLRVLPWKSYLSFWTAGTTTDQIALFISFFIYIIMLPFLIPLMIYKVGWNPRNWKLP